MTAIWPDHRGPKLEPPSIDSFIDHRLYRSRRVFELEMAHVFPESWVFVADVELLDEPGAAMVDRIGHEPVLLVCVGVGDVRAFRQRGRNRLRSDGTVDLDRLGPGELRLDRWERFAFVNLSGDAPPLAEWLEDVPDLLRGHSIGAQHRTYALDDEIAANWKVFVDNGYCDYHVPFVHREVARAVRDMRHAEERAGIYTNRLRLELNELGRSRRTPWPDLDAEARDCAYAIGVFPNLLILAFSDGGVHLLWWTPLAVDLTRARVQAYAHEVIDEESTRAGQEAVEAVQYEDIAVVESVQQGLAAGTYRPGPRHRLEERVAGFQRLLMKMLSDGAAKSA